MIVSGCSKRGDVEEVTEIELREIAEIQPDDNSVVEGSAQDEPVYENFNVENAYFSLY